MTKIKEILKFDSGADVFLFMIWVLGITAVAVLIVGIYFVVTNF